MRETYLPAFRAAVVEAGAYSIMGAYNRTNGEACCASPTLLQKILRVEWGFDGFVVSDCGAIADIHLHHHLTESEAESAALAVKNGCDLNCGYTYPALKTAVEEGLITEEEIDIAVIRLFTARFKLGLFDSPDRVPFASIPYEVNGSATHREYARKAARNSFVLLKNDGTLPVTQTTKSVAVIGPTANDRNVIIANYYGTPDGYVTPLEGFRERLGSDGVWYSEGCHLYKKEADTWGAKATRTISEAVASAKRSDIAFLCLGITAELEGEEGAVANSDGGGDRRDLELPGVQQKLLEAIVDTGVPVVVLLFTGSPIDISWAQEHVAAILCCFYPGEEAGHAITDIVFGDFAPAGRLPFTVPHLDQLPPFTDYSMDRRTYRYSPETPLFPFGFGLGYTSFTYSEPEVAGDKPYEAGAQMSVSVLVTNSGGIDADEVIQVYLSRPDSPYACPIRQLIGVSRVHLQAGSSERVSFDLDSRWLSTVRDDGRHVVYPGRYKLSIGGSQGDSRSLELGATENTTIGFTLAGKEVALPL